jgi:hypothetical protein
MLNSRDVSVSEGAAHPIVHAPPGTVAVRLPVPTPFGGMYRPIRRVTLTGATRVGADCLLRHPMPEDRARAPAPRQLPEGGGTRPGIKGVLCPRSTSVCGKAGGVLTHSIVLNPQLPRYPCGFA